MTATEIKLLTMLLAARAKHRQLDDDCNPQVGMGWRKHPHEVQEWLAEMLLEAGIEGYQTHEVMALMATQIEAPVLDHYQRTHQQAWDAFHEDFRWAMRAQVVRTPPPNRRRRAQPSHQYGLPEHLLDEPADPPVPGAAPRTLLEL